MSQPDEGQIPALKPSGTLSLHRSEIGELPDPSTGVSLAADNAQLDAFVVRCGMTRSQFVEHAPKANFQ